MNILVLAGGQGTGFFPLFQKSFSKQFVRLNDKSLFWTLERYREFPVFVSLRKGYADLDVAKGVVESPNVFAEFIEKPFPKNIFSAVAWPLYIMKCRHYLEGKDVVAVISANHYKVKEVIKPIREEK